MYNMKTAALTIRLDKDIDELLAKACRRSGKNRSEIAREALRRQLRLNNRMNTDGNFAALNSSRLSRAFPIGIYKITEFYGLA